MTENEISNKIIGAAIELHKAIDRGLLESAYENALVFDLKQLGFDVKCLLFIKMSNLMLVTE